MKKLLTVSALALALLVTGCGKKTETTGGEDKGQATGKFDTTVFTYVYTTDIETLNYLLTNKTSNSEKFTNFVDGLLESDNKGKAIPALAESFTHNEDRSVFTFKIRKGVKWVTAAGEEYAEVKAQDWVTALQYALDFNSQNEFLLKGVVKNAAEYDDGKVPFDQVGVKALDDYTLEYTLEHPTPYFPSMVLYSVYYPLNADFLASKGAGCKLGQGQGDASNCQFGGTDANSILYNGGYLLSVNDAKSKIEYVKNENYWDKDNVHFNKAVFLFDGGKDPYSVIKGFEDGIYAKAALSPTWKDFDKYLEKYKDYYTITLPNSSEFNLNFNYNRISYKLTDPNKTEQDRVNTHEAILNKNFRLAVLHAFDRVAYLRQASPEEVAVSTLRNMNNYPEIVTASDGSTYGQLVNQAYDKLTGTQTNLADGQDPFLNPEKAMEYIEKAKADGVKFPIQLDLPYINNASEVYANRAKSFKDSVEKNTQNNIIVNIIGASQEDVLNACYYNESPVDSDYDINTFSGWGPDYADPKTFADIYNVHDGAYLKAIGLFPLGEKVDGEVSEQEATARKLSDEILSSDLFKGYQELLDKADAIKTDNDARYRAYAEADAYLIANAMALPNGMQTRGYRVSHEVPLLAPNGATGISDVFKLKFSKLQEEIVTKKQYDEAYAAWEAKK